MLLVVTFITTRLEGAGRLQEKTASKLGVNGVLAPKEVVFASNCPKTKTSKIEKRVVADMLRQGKSDKNDVFDVKTVQRFGYLRHLLITFLAIISLICSSA